MRSLCRILGLNVILGVAAYRDLLGFQPFMVSASSSWTRDVEEVLFIPSETAPLLVVLMSAWLAYRRLPALLALPGRLGPVLPALLALALGSSIFVWATYTNAPDMLALALISQVVAVLVLWRGFAAVRILALPLVVLLFSIPLPGPLLAAVVWKLQCWTALLSGWFLYLLGTPALVSTDIIQLPKETFQVIESCSGLRSMQTLLLLSILMIDLFGRRRWHALLLIAAAAPVAFLTNGLRVLTLILNPHSKIHSIHTAQGIAVLLVGLFALYLIDGLLARFLGESAARQRVGSVSGAFRISPRIAPPRALAFTGLMGALVAVTLWMPRWKFDAMAAPHVQLDQVIPKELLGRSSLALDREDKSQNQIGFRHQIRRAYRSLGPVPGPTVEVFVGFGEHLDRLHSPYSPKTAFPGRGWLIEEEGGPIQVPGQQRHVWATWRVMRAGTRRIVAYYWYEDHRGLAAETARSFFALDRSPFARNLPIMAVRLSTDIPERTDAALKAALERLGSFALTLESDLEAFKRSIARDRTSQE